MKEIVRNTIKENSLSVIRLICTLNRQCFICDIDKNPLTKGYYGTRRLLEKHRNLIFQ
jgi:hypothetical protein